MENQDDSLHSESIPDWSDLFDKLAINSHSAPSSSMEDQEVTSQPRSEIPDLEYRRRLVEVVKPPRRVFETAIIGERGVGKTTFLNRHLSGRAGVYEIAGDDLKVYPLDFKTNIGEFRLCCWDKYDLRDGYFVAKKCAIIMHDVTARSTIRKISSWHRDLLRTCGNIPIVLCGNKVDVKKRQVTANKRFSSCGELQYYEISAKSNYNFEKPFLYLARELTGKPNLHFLESPALAPPEVQIDLAQQQLYEREMGIAAE